jgi:hypothetical protein
MWTWENPNQSATPNLANDRVTNVKSGIPTRVGL